ncbi:MAG: polysaccharide pyruvyl transferase family protein, partial [Rugosibacter sp.]|nr:polysaccharide pyruvyl transferase family protein [Rugosibacter sp.]
MKLNIVGYLGFENFGDDLMLTGLLDELNRNGIFQINLFVKNKVSLNGYATRWSNLKICLITLSKLSTILLPYYILTASKTIWCGGTCLYEDPSDPRFRGLGWIRRVVNYTRLFGRKFLLMNIGVNQIISKEAKTIIGEIVAGKSTYISVRDITSLENLLSVSSMRNSVVLGADLAFLNRINSVRSSSETDYIIFCGHRQYANNSEIVDFYAQTLSKISKTLNKKIVMISLHGGVVGDDLFHISIRERMDCTVMCIQYSSDAINILSNLFSNCFCIISMRLHGLIFAELLMKPSIGIAYSDKVKYFIEKTNNISNYRIKKVKDTLTPEE